MCAWVAAAIMIGMMIFQLLLAIGLPLGRMAWGGKYPNKLPNKMRVASFLSIGILLFAATSILEKSGALITYNNPVIAKYAVWSFAFFLALNTLGNYMSQNKLEKQIMTPVVFISSVIFFAVAIF